MIETNDFYFTDIYKMKIEIKKRNLINKDLCTNSLYKLKVFKDRKKTVSKFNLHKELKLWK